MGRLLVNMNPTAQLREMEEVFEKLFGPSARTGNPAASLPIDISEKEGKLFVKAAIPGIDPNDLEVSIENQVLTLRGETKSEQTTEDEKVYRREISYGSFTRSIRLPENLDFENVEAEHLNGIVTISLPRLVEEKPKALRVPVKASQPVLEATPEA